MSSSSEPAAKGTSAPVAGGAITAVPLAGLAEEVVAEAPSTPLAGAGEVVGTAVDEGSGLEVDTGTGVAVPVAVVVLPVWVDFVVVWLDEVVVWVVVVDLVVEVGVGVAVAADTTCTAGAPETRAPAGP